MSGASTRGGVDQAGSRRPPISRNSVIEILPFRHQARVKPSENPYPIVLFTGIDADFRE
jgi:hypothetical protein